MYYDPHSTLFENALLPFKHLPLFDGILTALAPKWKGPAKKCFIHQLQQLDQQSVAKRRPLQSSNIKTFLVV